MKQEQKQSQPNNGIDSKSAEAIVLGVKPEDSLERLRAELERERANSVGERAQTPVANTVFGSINESEVFQRVRFTVCLTAKPSGSLL